MSIDIQDIVIVGGGSAGWMTAATIASQIKNVNITVVESPNIPTVGVGESTVGGIRAWLRMVGIHDKDFVKETDASYKLAIKFNNFHKHNSGSWYYPFGQPLFDSCMHQREDWFIKKTLYPETPVDNYVDSYYPQMSLVKQNKMLVDHPDLKGFDFYNDTAFHFDAAKLGIWLRDKFCKNLGVQHISGEVVTCNKSDIGIDSIVLDNGNKIFGDLFIDCTGFNSLLLGKAMKVPFKSYEHILPNNRAWATRVAYTDKEKQLDSVTDCSALENGWVWNIPLWSRIGTGYVYSDNYITPKQAKVDFITHLNNKGYDTSNCTFKDIEMRVGIHEKLWVKNVVAIGLSAGFIEPLESTGLLTTHDFATNLVRMLTRSNSISQWDRDEFNLVCDDTFNYWANFVSMHYALSHRNDSKYWRDITQKSYTNLMPALNNLQTQGLYYQSIYQKNFVDFLQDDDGVNCLAAGMNWNSNDITVLNKIFPKHIDKKSEFKDMIDNLDQRKEKWNNAIKHVPSLYNFLLENFYKD